MQYENNTQYQLIHIAFAGTERETKFYIPSDKLNGYHLKREMAWKAQDSYAQAGITKDNLAELVKRGKEAIFGNNIEYSKKLDYTNSILSEIEYRLKYPADEEVALLKASFFLLIEGEDPNEINDQYTKQKLQIAKDCPETYAFFLHIGNQSVAYWQQLNVSLQDEDYIKTRVEILQRFKAIS